MKREFKCEDCEEVESVSKPHSLSHCECGGVMHEIKPDNSCPNCGTQEEYCHKCRVCLNCIDIEHDEKVTLLRGRISNLKTEKNKLIWEVKNLREGHVGEVV